MLAVFEVKPNQRKDYHDTVEKGMAAASKTDRQFQWKHEIQQDIAQNCSPNLLHPLYSQVNANICRSIDTKFAPAQCEHILEPLAARKWCIQYMALPRAGGRTKARSFWRNIKSREFLWLRKHGVPYFLASVFKLATTSFLGTRSLLTAAAGSRQHNPNRLMKRNVQDKVGMDGMCLCATAP